jgi:hypothetical protein
MKNKNENKNGDCCGSQLKKNNVEEREETR